MILEFKDHEYVDVDAIVALRWMDEISRGVVAFRGADKIVVTKREDFDVIEKGFIASHKSHMMDKELKKISYVKRGEE
jgi:hypothetical protein